MMKNREKTILLIGVIALVCMAAYCFYLSYRLAKNEALAEDLIAGQVFEKIGKSSTGKLADLTLAIRENIEAIAAECGHEQPRGVWQKIKTRADKIRNAPTVSDKSGDAEPGGRNFKPVDEYIIDKMIECFNKAHRQVGESKAVDKVRPDLHKILMNLGVKPTDNRLITNK